MHFVLIGWAIRRKKAPCHVFTVSPPSSHKHRRSFLVSYFISSSSAAALPERTEYPVSAAAPIPPPVLLPSGG